MYYRYISSYLDLVGLLAKAMGGSSQVGQAGLATGAQHLSYSTHDYLNYAEYEDYKKS